MAGEALAGLAEKCLGDSKYVGVVSHWDLDGIVSAALLVYALRSEGKSYDYKLSSPSRLLRNIRAVIVEGEALAVADLYPLPSELEEILAIRRLLRGLYWFDHHDWDPEVRESLADTGAVLVLDPAMPAARIVSSYLSGQCGLDVTVFARLVEAAVDDDLNIGRDPLAQKWRIVLRVASWSSRYALVDAISDGTPWPELAERIYESRSPRYYELLEESIEKTLVYSLSCGIEVAVIEAPELLSPTDVYNAARNRYQAAIYAILYEKGVSFRSEKYDVEKVAAALGGGGHPHASGATLSKRLSPDALISIIEEAICGCDDRVLRGEQRRR